MDEYFEANIQVQNENKVITHSGENFDVDNNNCTAVEATELGGISQVTGDHSQFDSQWFEERRRQAKSSFNIAIISAAISVVGVLVCTVSLYNNDIPEATVTAIVSLLSGGSSARCFKLSDDANKRLDEAAKELRRQD